MSDPIDAGAGTATAAERSTSRKVPLPALVALVIGSMIGGGIFGLPHQMASAAAPGPLIVGWIVTGLGMLMLAFVFQRLAVTKPEIDAGIYGYARAGFGDLVGFSSAWGYWMSAWIGNVGYLVLLMASLGVFLPGFGNGNTAQAIIIASLVMWLFHVLILRGIREAAVVNALVTIGKVLPLIVFIVIGIFSFKLELFTADFWGTGDSSLGGVLHQVKSMMLVTVWVFIGVEGASVFSERARSRTDVGRATIIGFVSVLALLLAVNILSYGIVARPELAQLSDPSLAGVLEAAVGPWGAKFIALGLVISLVGALLSWFLMCAEIIRVPATEGLMPRVFGKENAKEVPAAALWLTMLLVQLFLIWTYFNASTYTALILLASSLILLPYLLSALYQVIACLQARSSGRPVPWTDMVIGVLGTVYGLWLLYAAGLVYLLYTSIFYLLGLPFFLRARSEQQARPLLKPLEWGLVAVLVAMAAYAVYGLSQGTLSL
ncbi:arginine-ornithine antiporter [Actinomyces bowdenii]|uniref:arginine-ornithine antiporter n=1 Tax=Actinomyces bowdenii TaxID=131109 RepID=UPI00214CBDA3|nr:arginine-ornithine antiporter [Actinomyces bowdenii]MCR2051762.1 arginine-ornithine antiporter [Actinomyces bowdenii]